MIGIFELFIRYRIDPIILGINGVFIRVGFQKEYFEKFFHRFIIIYVKICQKEVVLILLEVIYCLIS